MRMIFAMQYKKFSEMPIDTTHIGLIKSAGYGVAAALGAFFGIHGVKAAVFEALIGLMVLDTLSGIIKWLMIDKVTVRSNSLKDGVLRKVIALFIPLTIGLMIKATGTENDVFLSVVFTVLCLAECYSIWGNLYSAVTKKDIQEYDALSAILKFLKDATWGKLQEKLNGAQNPDEPTNPTP